METLYDKSSLILNPGVYDTGKVYVTKPFDGSGDLTFTRTGDTATRVNADGLIEKVRTNLALYSQDISNASYIDGGDGAYSVIRTANYTTAPDGTQTATRIQITRGSTYAELYQRKTIASGIEFTVSFWAKALSGTPTLATVMNNGYFNLVTFTSEWVRYTYTTTSVGGGSLQGFNLITWSSLPTTSTSADVAIWGVQIETGVATEYIPTTSTAVSVGPVANLPRIDYTGGGCGKLLLEPQRTNLVLFSEQLDNSNWYKVNTTITANAAISPDGYANADQLNLSASSDSSIYQAVSGSSAIYSTSIFAKYVSGGKYLYIFSPLNSEGANVWFDIEAGTVANQVGGFTGAIQDYGNGWFRCTLTNTSNKTLNYIQLGISSTSSNRTLSQASVTHFWGAQVEAGSYVSSYIGPTLSAAVTRGADSCEKTGIGSLFGSEFTLFVEGVRSDDTGPTRYIVAKGPTAGTYNDFISIERYADGLLCAVTNSSGTLLAQIAGGVLTAGQTFKVAMRCKSGDYALFLNGVKLGDNVVAHTPNSEQLKITYFDYYGKFSNAQTLVLPALTDAQAIELTTL